MEWKKPFALFAGSVGFFLSFASYLFGAFMTGNPHVLQGCNVGNVQLDNFDKLICTYLEDFKSFGFDNLDAKSAAVLIGVFT